MTTKEKITAKIKELGYNSRQVSVRSRHAGYSSALLVTIRDASISINKIEEAIASFEKIDRCHLTGEILSGGNTFIDVEYNDEAKAKIAAPFVELVKNAMVTTSGNSGENIVDSYVLFAEGRNAFYVHYFSNDGSGTRVSQNCINPESLALAIGKHKINSI